MLDMTFNGIDFKFRNRQIFQYWLSCIHPYSGIICFKGCNVVCFSVLYLSHSMTKPTKCPVHPAKTQISLDIHPVWLDWVFAMRSEWVAKNSIFLRADSGDSVLGGYPGWSESSLGAEVNLLILSCCGSILSFILIRLAAQTSAVQTFWI